MPSSSWRLIRSDITPAGPGQVEVAVAGTPPAPAEAGGPAATVFRGRGRGSSRGSGRGGSSQAPGGMPQVVAGFGGNVDQAALAEEIQRIERAAEERGYESGRNRAEAELRAAVEGASALADRLEAIAPERTSDIAHSIAELALSVAKRIIQHEVRIEPSLLCTALETAVSTINGSPEAHVLLNPAAVEPVQGAWEALHGRAYLGKKWFFEGDPTLPAGGCTLRYEHGFVEAGLEAQLEEIGIALDRAIPNLARGTVEEDVA
ncbi:MAG: FliH/SctL family protein [Candidatus Limnocylindrales bacterium]|jgi:flagellar biosynthesis/type III secretory pathway protein FliH